MGGHGSQDKEAGGWVRFLRGSDKLYAAKHHDVLGVCGSTGQYGQAREFI